MDVFEFQKHINNLSGGNILKILIKSVEADKNLVEYQIDQWEKGEDSKGSILGVYSPATEIISRGRKKAGTPYDLKDSGLFRKGTYLIGRIKRNTIQWEIGSTDSKSDLLEKKIGNRLFGFQDPQMDSFIDFLEEIYIQKLKI